MDTAAQTRGTRGRASAAGRPAQLLCLAFPRVRLALALAAGSAMASSPASAGAGLSGSTGLRWSLSALGGAAQFDPHLSDYRWNTNPRAAWGLQATAEAGRFMAGARALRTGTTQASGIPGEASAPNVRLTSLEGLGGYRLAAVAGVDLFVTASYGWAHLGYDPDRMTFTPLSGTSDVVVHFEPVDTWTAAAGLRLRRALTFGLAVGLQVERSYFALDTAHRNGATIEEQRETFGNWGARVELSWILGAP